MAKPMSTDRVPSTSIGAIALNIGAAIFLFGAMIHLVAPLIGPDWYAFLNAPASVVASARQATLFAPLGGLLIGGMMILCAIYGFAARHKVRLPLMRLAMVAISAICLTRGLFVIPVIMLNPALATPFNIVSSIEWFLAGASYLIGTMVFWRTMSGRGS
jgi:hypothetical protein